MRWYVFRWAKLGRLDSVTLSRAHVGVVCVRQQASGKIVVPGRRVRDTERQVPARLGGQITGGVVKRTGSLGRRASDPIGDTARNQLREAMRRRIPVRFRRARSGLCRIRFSRATSVCNHADLNR